MTPLAGILLVLAVLGALMAGVKILQSQGAVGAELGRKLIHLGMGVVCLAFPWLFATPTPVWILAGCAITGLAAVRFVPVLRRQLGGVLGGVDRISFGELYFPLAVAVVFALADGERAAFLVPVAVLTFADTAGALVGQRWGRLRYHAVESTKSIEGSIAVFAVTWLCTSPVLAGFAEVSFARALLTGFVLGLFAAVVEAVSWRGIDNLLVPLVAVAQLRVYPLLSLGEIIGRVAVMVALVAAMLAWRRSLLDDSARLGAGLAMYLFWSLGDWRWLVAPTLLLASYVRLMPTIPGGPVRHRLAAVVCIGFAGMVAVLIHAWWPDPRWLWVFTLGLATQQAIIAAVRFSQGRPRWPRWQWWLVAAAQAIGVHTIGFLIANGLDAFHWRGFLVGAVTLAVALGGFMAWDRRLALPEDLNARWWRQGLTAAVASAAGFILLQP